MSAAEASSDARAHSITSATSLGPTPQGPPQTVALRPTEPGPLVLCSDGLWNYAPTAADIAALLHALPSDASTLTVAHSLADAALAGGGRDDITVTVVDIQPRRRNPT